jgi:hypothetical protein
MGASRSGASRGRCRGPQPVTVASVRTAKLAGAVVTGRIIEPVTPSP